MDNLLKKTIFFLFFFLFFSKVLGEIVNKIEITGNERISSETIIMFSDVKTQQDLNQNEINKILKNLYETNFFKNIEVSFKNNVLKIKVNENPIIDKIVIEGIRADKIKKAISAKLSLKSRSSFNQFLLTKDNNEIKNSLKSLGYYFSKIDTQIEKLDNNRIILTYKINLGEKSKIKKITFIGNKIFKDKKLRSIIVSEETKFWKFITGKKFLNENTINLDKRLLKNFYLSKGYYNVSINSSFAKLIENDQFELIYSIEPNKKIFFNNISLKLPNDFDETNFDELKNLFSEIKNKPYSINSVNDILDKIDQITTNEEFHSVDATVTEDLIDDKINLNFEIRESEKLFVEKINIFGNNVTREEVIRNNLAIDEGDPYNKILQGKSVNNLKSLNFFKKVEAEIIKGSSDDARIINYTVQEKPTGEISAGAGVGTSGGSIGFSVKENNYLGKGISLEGSATLSEESLKGIFSVTNPNFKNSNKSINFSIQATELDRIKDFGYKNNKTGFSLGTDFEYLDDFHLGVSTSTFYERIETDSTASARQKKLDGNYFDTFLRFNFDYDKRNQYFQTTEGFRSRYFLDLPLISKTNTLTNTYDYKIYSELYDQNISSASFFIKASKSINNKDIKLSERLNIPSSKLRGFEKGKVGPLDGNDYIGGNFVSAINLSSTIPQILENSENVDVAVFFDAANVWGVDYDSSLDNNKIRSSIGLGVDWFTMIGPLNFSFALPLTKEDTDKTESFRFNIGTSF
jgi:outer membrane protein insertion porin family